MNSLFFKDVNLDFKYSQSLSDRDFQYRDHKEPSHFFDAPQTLALSSHYRCLKTSNWSSNSKNWESHIGLGCLS